VIACVTTLLDVEYLAVGYLKRQVTICPDLSQWCYWRNVNMSFWWSNCILESKTNTCYPQRNVPGFLQIGISSHLLQADIVHVHKRYCYSCSRNADVLGTLINMRMNEECMEV
jgi:hypothetical protein